MPPDPAEQGPPKDTASEHRARTDHHAECDHVSSPGPATSTSGPFCWLVVPRDVPLQPAGWPGDTRVPEPVPPITSSTATAGGEDGTGLANGNRQAVLKPFAERLNEARLTAGMPSYAMFEKADTYLRSSTISDVLRGRTSPTLDFVVAFIRACRTFSERSGNPVDGVLLDVDAWRADWRQLQRTLGPYRQRKKHTGEQFDISGEVDHPANGWSASAQQLPPDVPVFIGRSSQVDLLGKLSGLVASGVASPITVIDGMPGVGKTSLVVHWAHRVRHRFEDGILFLDLHGFGPAGPIPTERAIATLLRAIGEACDHALELTELVTRYCNIVASRRLLVILDDVASIDQVRPLLQATGRSMVLITSRHDLSRTTHEGIRRITLQPMSLCESTDLLDRLLTASRDRQTYDAEKVVELCGRLPLALRIVAERAARRRDVAVETLADELRNECCHGESADTHGSQPTAFLCVAFHWSYAALPEADRAAFRLIGLHPSPEFGIHAAAALLDRPIRETLHRVEILASAHLLDRIAEGRYRLHNLVASYARRLCEEQDDEDARASAVRRLLGWYLRAAACAASLLPARHRGAPGDVAAMPSELLGLQDEDDALHWCDVERTNLVAAVHLASSVGEHHTAWRLPHLLMGYFDRRKPWPIWIEVYRIATESARRADDLQGLAHSLHSLGVAYRAVRSFHLAMRSFEGALNAYRTLGEAMGQAQALSNLGATARDLGSPRVALNWYQQCLQVVLRTADEDMLGDSLHRLAEVELELGLHLQAYAHSEQSLALFRRLGDAIGEGRSLITLGRTYAAIELHSQAIDYLHFAVTTLQAAGDQRGVIHALDCLGRLFRPAEQVDDAG